MRFIYALIASISRGLQYTFVELLLARVHIMAIFLISSIVNVIFFGLITYFGHFDLNLKAIQHDRQTLGWMALVVITYLIASTIIVFAIKSKNATTTGLIEISYPIFIIIFSSIFLKNYHVSRATIAGGILIFGWISIIYIFNK